MAAAGPARQLGVGREAHDRVRLVEGDQLHECGRVQSPPRMAIPETLERLLVAQGPSGQEAQAAEAWREAAGTFGEVSGNVLGSSWVQVPGTRGGRCRRMNEKQRIATRRYWADQARLERKSAETKARCDDPEERSKLRQGSGTPIVATGLQRPCERDGLILQAARR